MNHCDEILLDHLVNGDLDLQKSIFCRFHLLFCRECQSKLKRVRYDQKFLNELRQGVLIMERAHVMVASIDDTKRKTTKTDKHINRRKAGSFV